jgi:cyclic di-GMP phosphodiesterase
MELVSIQFAPNRETREFINTAEFACLEETCRFATTILDGDRQLLSDGVAERCIAIAQLLNLSGSDIIRLEIAARVHRVGELFLDESLRCKSFLDMTPGEMRAYRHYPIFSALRFSQYINRELYEILLNHREYYSGAGFLNNECDEKIPAGARILCVATEYEELVMYRGDDAIKQHTIQDRMMRNTIGRYDAEVVNALMLTIARESISH